MNQWDRIVDSIIKEESKMNIYSSYDDDFDENEFRDEELDDLFDDEDSELDYFEDMGNITYQINNYNDDFD